jgi:epimerase transport system membrane fusion protein
MGDLGALESDQQNAYQRIGEMQERVLQLRRDWLQQIAEDKDEVHGAIIDIRERLSATRDVLARQTIRAPRAGRIVSLDINTIGGVINRGQGILEIVPQDATYILETRVKPSDIDEVILNGTAQVRLTAYSFRTTPPIKGRVVYVSADSLIAPENGQPYYQVDIKIDPGEFEALPGVHMIPGMPAQAMLQTGEQTIVEYLINPMIGSLETALRENK